MSRIGQLLVSSHRSHPAGPIYQNLDTHPQYRSQRRLPDTQAAIGSVFPMKAWKEYSDREVFNTGVRNMHQSNTFTPRCGAGKGSSVFSSLYPAGQPGHHVAAVLPLLSSLFMRVSPSEKSQEPAGSLQPSKYSIVCICYIVQRKMKYEYTWVWVFM